MKKYAVITGASSGIGKEFAKILAREGFALLLTARRGNRLEKLRKHLKTECLIVEADLTKEEDCRRLFQTVEDKEVAVWINNAGFGHCGTFKEGDLQKELDMLAVNVRALHFLTKLVLKKMERQNYGAILNVASCAGLMPAGPYMATYYATKSYVTSLTRAIAEELRYEGSPVYIGCLCPGPVNTEFNDVAEVEFALKGISPAWCARYGYQQMKRGKTVIVPKLSVKFAVTFGRFLPETLYIRIAAHQQKKKKFGRRNESR
ncbi:SDR family oxidoreductase [Petralouisia muris]|uniref:SDR family oxidoreductase n=1 Tax=Petralouisia muris TaxID=3032872 RepID=A0AC61S080_9FIRM|nr:SDR family oxidoreductase [Petralouisia muris]TGY97828.1 SDR family oxidoreductase [Petralouisia muris]